ncbi:MAG TPA: two-component sensor histidine kinase, partial [Alphaproteobacteria bacterium]|nr:two-component sensor histidine kinase [Alphaproteobacteria bacterium]
MPEGLPLHRTTTFRLAVLYLGLFAASVAAVLAVVYLATVRFVDAQTTQSLAAELNGLAQQYREGGLTGLRDAVSERSAIQPSDTLYL